MIGALVEQVRAGFLLATSYRLNFALGLVTRWWTLVWVYYLARLVGPTPPLSPELKQGFLAFALVGMAVEQYLRYLLAGCSEKLREDQLSGLLPALLTTPAPPALALFGPVLWGVAERALTLLAMLLVVALVFGVPLADANWAAAAIVLLLATGAVAAWGLLSACFTLVFKRGDPVLWLSDTLGFVFSGAVLPLEVLPRWMRWISAAYPHAHAIRAARSALLLGSPLGELSSSLAVLAAFAALLVPLSAAALRLALRHVRTRGSAAFY